MESLVRLVVARSSNEYRPTHIAYGYLFFTLVPITIGPVLIRLLGSWVDAWVGLGRLLPEDASLALAISCFVLGIPWLVWAAVLDWTKGSGTPLPWFPPKQLLVTGPYRYIRNPQTFGAVFWWCGWALISNSPAGLVVGVGAIPTVVCCYIRLVEERELARRFGDAYTEYKATTQFILPGVKRTRVPSDQARRSVAIGRQSADSH
jgi:protein-S-isoprenylcysteine O-methyltransferase Ste14